MSKIKIIPLKIYKSVFIVLLFFDLIFWLLLKKVNSEISIDVFLIGLVPVIVTGCLYFAFNRIVVFEDKITIKDFGVLGFKKIEFSIKDISKYEVKIGELYFGQRRNYFIIHFDERLNRKSFIINEDKYFNKQLKMLFNDLNSFIT